MQYIMTPYAPRSETFAIWRNAFSDDELDWLQAKARAATNFANVGGSSNDEETKKVRRSQVDWLLCTDETRWVFEKLAHVAASLNADFFRLDITGMGEALQLTNYLGGDNGMYGWHMDGGGTGISRKLSLVLQLSDPCEFEGGNLQVFNGGDITNPITVSKQRGLIAVFPSYTLHQVTPVTSGSRQSLVCWISGPALR